MSFHSEGVGTGKAQSLKERRVREGRAHAALVYDGSTCVGWCQFGPTDELPRIKHRRAYTEGFTNLPDWRITCFFVDRDYRRKGVAAAALSGALREIARLGGGAVESYPEDVKGRAVSGSFLYNATVSMFQQQGFRPVRRLGKNHWVVSKTVRKAPRKTPR
jgi:GNAT superfamily N-acetyltransferase